MDSSRGQVSMFTAPWHPNIHQAVTVVPVLRKKKLREMLGE